MAEPTPSTCPVCGGDGKANNSFCIACMGGGSLPVIGISRYLKETLGNIMDKVNDIKEKVDEIKEVIDEL